ncbi:DUF3558 domain-containing protein [Corynebacterium sp. sy017]|nr:DUF3558 domain-containing protein [Corynebacterium sp. sy017]TSD92604.1 DUF3558 domain-containing protein [Corynebacterium sp. SY003]
MFMIFTTQKDMRSYLGITLHSMFMLCSICFVLCACSTAGSSKEEGKAAASSKLATSVVTSTSGKPTSAVATFDRDSPDFHYVNICAELSTEQFREMGLEFTGEVYEGEHKYPHIGCSFGSQEKDISDSDTPDIDVSGVSKYLIVLGVDTSSREMVEEKTTRVWDITDPMLVGAYASLLQGPPEQCMASIATPNGRLYAAYASGIHSEVGNEELCTMAARTLRQIYLMKWGNNGSIA